MHARTTRHTTAPRCVGPLRAAETDEKKKGKNERVMKFHGDDDELELRWGWGEALGSKRRLQAPKVVPLLSAESSDKATCQSCQVNYSIKLILSTNKNINTTEKSPEALTAAFPNANNLVL